VQIVLDRAPLIFSEILMLHNDPSFFINLVAYIIHNETQPPAGWPEFVCLLKRESMR